MRVLRAAFTATPPGRSLALMPSAHPAQLPPAAAPGDIERERAALSRALAVRWPRAARDVLLISARVDRFNRRAHALGLPQLAAAEAVAAASAMWAAMALSGAAFEPTETSPC